jgi:hypothetical protein
VYVALGSPKQERLICRIRATLPHAWWLGVGISFSFISGDVRRAPVWMQKTGLEWTHRLLQEPDRLFKRYVVVGIPFAMRLLGSAALKRVVGKRKAKLTSRTRQLRRSVNGVPIHQLFERSNTDGSTELLVPGPQSGLESGDSNGVASGAPTVITRNESLTTVQSLQRIRALVLLGGTVRPTPLHTSTRRSILDLPLEQETTLLNHWLGHAAAMARYAQMDVLKTRVLVNAASYEPKSGAARYAGAYQVEQDSSEYRGTGGVLRDLCDCYDDNDLVLIASASQVLIDPLHAIAAALDHKRADVTLISHKDGTPSGVMLARCAVLRNIPALGFVDMKEQALPLIAGKFDVKVVHCRRPTGLPLRTLGDYMAALRTYHRKSSGRPQNIDPLAEDYQPTFSIIEAGATVDSRATVCDSVVLRGGVVEAGASLVRSVVCPGGTARAKTTSVDRFIVG